MSEQEAIAAYKLARANVRAASRARNAAADALEHANDSGCSMAIVTLAGARSLPCSRSGHSRKHRRVRHVVSVLRSTKLHVMAMDASIPQRLSLMRPAVLRSLGAQVSRLDVTRNATAEERHEAERRAAVILAPRLAWLSDEDADQQMTDLVTEKLADIVAERSERRLIVP